MSMTTDGSMRASDDDRERVVEILREQTAQGRLTLEEFGERLDAAYAAKTWDELRKLTTDLPVEVVFADEKRPLGHHPLPVERPYEPTRGGGFPTGRLLWIVPVLAWSAFWVLAIVGAHAPFIVPLLVIAVVCLGAGRRRRLTYPARGRGEWPGHGPRGGTPWDGRPPHPRRDA